MDDLLESIHILRLLNETTKNSFNTFSDDLKDHVNADNFITYIIKGFILINSCSFLDEWDNNLKDIGDNKINTLKKIAKPAIDRIKKWTGLKEFRNALLAHGFRGRKIDNKFVFTSSYYDNLLIPEHITEISLLCFCIDIATQIIVNPFEMELSSSSEKFYQPPNYKEIKIIDYNKESIDILQKIDDLKSSLK